MVRNRKGLEKPETQPAQEPKWQPNPIPKTTQPGLLLFPTRAQLSPPLLAQQIPRRPSPLQPERPRSAPLRSARSPPAPSLSPRNTPSPVPSTCPAVSRSPSPNPAQTTTPAQPRASCLPDRMAPPVSFPSRPHGTAQHSTQLFPNRPSQATPARPRSTAQPGPPSAPAHFSPRRPGQPRSACSRTRPRPRHCFR